MNAGNGSNDQRAIMATANDAILSKLSASSMAYYTDPFLPYFAQNAQGHQSVTARNIGSSTTVGFESHNGFLNAVPQHQILGPLPSSYDDEMEEESSSFSRCAPLRFQPPGRRLHHPHPGIPSRRQYPGATPSPSFPGQLPQQPLIRRGTHARVCVMDYAISHFVSLASQANQESVQIVILGSGRDSTYLRAQSGFLHGLSSFLSSSENDDDRPNRIAWYEVDHASVIGTKHELLKSCSLLEVESHSPKKGTKENDGEDKKDSYRNSFHILTKRIRKAIVPTVKSSSSSMNDALETNRGWIELDPDSNPYHLIEHDLRDPLENLLNYMTKYHSFQIQLPTLFLMECVQMYLPETSSRQVLSAITDTCHYPFLALYDPILQNDAFGNVMAKNLRQSGITDPSTSLWQVKTLQGQIQKMMDCGFHFAIGCDMMDAYQSILKEEDRRRANRCEMLDEVEEWMLLMKHYCFVLASMTKGSDGKKDVDLNFKMSAYFCAESSEETCSLGFRANRCVTLSTVKRK